MKFLEKIILGISDTHDASAAIIKNGKILHAVSEERIQRVKSAGGFPRGAILQCLESTNLKLSDIDYVAVAGTRAVPVNMLGISSTLSLEDYITIQEKIRKPKFYENKDVSFTSVFPDYKSKGETYYSIKDIPLKEYRQLSLKERKQISEYRLKFIAKETKKEPSEIFFLDHHLCHIYYGYYASSFRGEKVVAISLDGGGDGVYESISIFDENSNHKRIYAAHEAILGPIYSMITLILRMKPNEHEFKVMGLAPYAKKYSKERTIEYLRKILTVDGIKFIRDKKLKDFYFAVKEKLKFERFDGIAGGVQDWLEEKVSEWVINVLEQTKSKKLVFSGGVALNVKANQIISNLNAVEEMFIPPGSGDESLSIGACWALLDKLNISISEKRLIKPLENSYLGCNIKEGEIEKFVNHPIIKTKYALVDGNPNEIAANALANNELVAVCRGRMEFGPRSLGNRSLIANPSSKDTVEKINSSIKGRDFWMPFAPSILADKIASCSLNHNKVDLSYMTCTVNSKKAIRNNFIATIHSYDNTMRVHSVDFDKSPQYYNLIKAFFFKTGIPGVLNTSLNIHGKPIVMNPIDIINELLLVTGVSIDNIIIENLFFKKKPMVDE